jgi:hypothetical protein
MSNDVDETSLAQLSPALSSGSEERNASVEASHFLRFSLRSILLSALGCTIVVAAVTSGLRASKKRALEKQVRQGLSDAYLGIRNFESARQCMPASTYRNANGSDQSSWRFQILPYMGVNQYGRQYYSSEWTASINQPIRSSQNVPYCIESTDKDGDTNIYAIKGVDTAFEHHNYPGFSKRKFDEIPPSLILLMETSLSKVHWMQPGDYDADELLAANGQLVDTVHGVLSDRSHVMFADGEVWALSPSTPMSAIHPFLTINGAKNADRSELLAPYRVD